MPARTADAGDGARDRPLHELGSLASGDFASLRLSPNALVAGTLDSSSATFAFASAATSRPTLSTDDNIKAPSQHAAWQAGTTKSRPAQEWRKGGLHLMTLNYPYWPIGRIKHRARHPNFHPSSGPRRRHRFFIVSRLTYRPGTSRQLLRALPCPERNEGQRGHSRT